MLETPTNVMVRRGTTSSSRLCRGPAPPRQLPEPDQVQRRLVGQDARTVPRNQDPQGTGFDGAPHRGGNQQRLAVHSDGDLGHVGVDHHFHRSVLDQATLRGTTQQAESVDDVFAAALEIGFPVAIKASAGGGGKGLKIATSVDEVERAYDTARREGEAYFADFPGRWRHGDWLRATPRGSFVISGRSDSTLNRGGVRMGTADLYAVIEGFDEVVDSLVIDTTALGSTEEGALVCFVVLADGASLVDVEPSLRTALRKELSPRHVPDRFVLVDEVPRTLSGKKCEVPVKRILAGVDPEKAVSRGALKNPEALAPFLEMAGRATR